MSNHFERESERDSEERSSASMMHLLGQMLMLPFSVFVYGMEMFVRTIKGIQHATDQGIELMGGVKAPQHGVLTEEDCSTDRRLERVVRDSGQQPRAPGEDPEIVTPTSTSGPSADVSAVTQKETMQMIDKSLSDDQLKLVRFKILFVKRDYEAAFPEQEALVPDNMTGEAFTAWKVAEFIQLLGKGKTPPPREWPRDDKHEHRRPTYPKEPDLLRWDEKDEVWYLFGFPEKDKKYLRVYYEVLDRYVREDEDDEVVVLKEIRDAINALPPPYQHGGGGGGTTAPGQSTTGGGRVSGTRSGGHSTSGEGAT